jgi:hypothetical protein
MHSDTPSSKPEGKIMAIQRNREKLKTLVHYVIARCEDPAMLGSIKLNKVLWLSDLVAYVGTGTPITGERYVKQQFGPVALTMPAIIDELRSENKIATREHIAFGNPKTDYFALNEPDRISDLFTADEISAVEQAREFVCEQNTAMQISAFSHDVIWELAEIGEEIPYEAMLATRLDGVTKDDVNWARGAHERSLQASN